MGLKHVSIISNDLSMSDFHSICMLILTEAGVDYDGTMIVVVFPLSSVQGDTVCADVPIMDDNVLECSQDFTVFITSATLATDISGQERFFLKMQQIS